MGASFRSVGEKLKKAFKKRDSFCQAQVKGRGRRVWATACYLSDDAVEGWPSSLYKLDDDAGNDTMSEITDGSSTTCRLFRKAGLLTRPARRAETRRSSGKAAARSARRRIRSLTFADGRELVSALCLRGESYTIFTRLPIACRHRR